MSSGCAAQVPCGTQVAAPRKRLRRASQAAAPRKSSGCAAQRNRHLRCLEKETGFSFKIFAQFYLG